VPPQKFLKMVKLTLRTKDRLYPKIIAKFNPGVLKANVDIRDGALYPLKLAQSNLEVSVEQPSFEEYRAFVIYDITAGYFHAILSDIDTRGKYNTFLSYVPPDPTPGGPHTYVMTLYVQRPQRTSVPRQRKEALEPFVSSNGLVPLATLSFQTTAASGAARGMKRSAGGTGSTGVKRSAGMEKQIYLCKMLAEKAVGDPKKSEVHKTEKLLMENVYPEAVIIIAGFLGHKMACPFI
jgi:hypothetical protein